MLPPPSLSNISLPEVFLLVLGIGLLFFCSSSELMAAELKTPYTVSFQDPEDSGFLSQLRQVSSSVQNRDDPPATVNMVKRRARNDLPRMTEVLKAQGYFEARIDLKVDPRNADNPVLVEFTVHPGPAYHVREVKIRPWRSSSLSEPNLPNRQELGLPSGTRAKADAIRRGKSQLQNKLQSQGFVLAEIDSPVLRLHSEQKSVDLTYRVDPGPRARFGPVRIQGLNRVKESYVRDKIPWNTGELYDPKSVRNLQDSLLKTGLFNMVQVEHADSADDQNQLPMTVRVREVDHKRVSLRLGYETDTGPQGKAAWEHLNLRGKGRKLRFELEASQIKQELLTRYTQENLADKDLDLVLRGSVFREELDAYTSTGGRMSSHLEHQYHPNLRLGAGLGYKGSRVEDSEGDQTFHQLSLPAFAVWDTRNDILDPRQGTNHSLHLTPMLGFLGEEFSFLKSSLSSLWYFDLLPEKGRAVLALRGKVGSISASDTADVPADERWYAGGGGSIRGYPYQEVGPYRDGDPYGGRSLLETSAEFRWKWTPKIGSVAFVDAGNAFDSSIPDPADKLYWGAGCGMRYYTGIGPLRLDVALPLTSDEHIDDNFQVYISLGQAF
ncbi:MAG: autotransporter assembly complex family protein [Desulfovermiculus sp.]